MHRVQRPWRISPKQFVMSVRKVAKKPTKSEDTAVGGKRISVVKQGSEATETEGTQARIKDDISQSNVQRKLEQRTVSVPKESNGRV